MYIPMIEVELDVETGERYTSDSRDIDVGFGNYLVSLLDKLRESDPVKYGPFYKYTKRAASKKLILSSETDPKRFLRQARQRYFEKDGKANAEHREALPLVYFHRALGFEQSLTGNEVKMKNVGEVYDENGLAIAAVDALPTTISYMIYALAWDNGTLDKLVTGLTAALISSNRTFLYKTSVLSSVEEGVPATMSPANSLSWSDLSPANLDDRLLVYQGMIEVTANYFQARCINKTTLKFSLADPVPMYQTGDF